MGISLKINRDINMNKTKMGVYTLRHRLAATATV